MPTSAATYDSFSGAGGRSGKGSSSSGGGIHPTTTTPRQIVRAFRARGWSIQPAALDAIGAILTTATEQHSNSNNPLLLLSDLLRSLELHMKAKESNSNNSTANNSQSQQQQPRANRVVTLEILQAVVGGSSSNRNKKEDEEGSSSTTVTTTSTGPGRTKLQRQQPNSDNDNDAVMVVHAFATPRLQWNVLRRQFQVVSKEEWEIFGTAEEKVRLCACMLCVCTLPLPTNPFS
jgi:hypothetical protein